MCMPKNRYLRLGIFGETALLRVIVSPIRQLPIVHIILAASVSLDDADDDQQQDQEGDRKHHADEPTSGRHVFVGNLDGTL